MKLCYESCLYCTFIQNMKNIMALLAVLHLLFSLAPQTAFSRSCQATKAHIKRFLVHKLNLIDNTIRLKIFTTCTGGFTSKITFAIISKKRFNAYIFIKKYDSDFSSGICNWNDSHPINHMHVSASRDKMGDFRKTFSNYINNAYIVGN